MGREIILRDTRVERKKTKLAKYTHFLTINIDSRTGDDSLEMKYKVAYIELTALRKSLRKLLQKKKAKVFITQSK